MGYDERKHGYMTPCVSVIEGHTPQSHGSGSDSGARGPASESSFTEADEASGDEVPMPTWAWAVSAMNAASNSAIFFMVLYRDSK